MLQCLLELVQWHYHSSVVVASYQLDSSVRLLFEDYYLLQRHNGDDEGVSSLGRVFAAELSDTSRVLIALKIDNLNITKEEYIRLQEEKYLSRGETFNWQTTTYGKREYCEDEDDCFTNFETKFPAIVLDNTLTFDAAISCGPTVSPLRDNEIDFKISFDEFDNKDYTIVYDEKSFSYKIIYVNNLKMNSENDNDKVNMPSFLSPEPKMLERLSGNEYYCFLDGFAGFFQILIAPEDQEKTTFTCPYGTFAYGRMPFRLSNAPATFQRCTTTVFHDMVEDFMEVFMDDFSVFEGIVLGHKISGKGIEVDKAKIDVIAKLPYPINVKGVRSFLGHAGDFTVGAVLGQRIDRKFKPIYYVSKTLNDAQAHYTTTEKELLAVVFSFDKFWPYLILSKTVVYTDHSALKAKNLAADHLSRLENLNIEELAEKEIEEKFPDEHLMILKTKINDEEPWYANYVNYIVRKVVPPEWTPEKKKRFFSQMKNYFWDEPYAFRLCPDNVRRRCVARSEILEILVHWHSGLTGGHHSALVISRKVYEAGFYWPGIFRDAKDYVMKCNASQEQNPGEPRNESNVKTEFSKELLTELQNNTFSGRSEEDVIEHIDKVLKIQDLVKIAKIRKEEGLLNDEVLSDEEWEEHEYGSLPNDSFPKPYFEIDKNKNNEDAYNSSGMDLSDAPQFENINNEQPNEVICRVDKFEVIKYTIKDNKEFLAICTREYDS
ncbi:reverse transcriptase domain-containing protein [Tanacetum coccineum]